MMSDREVDLIAEEWSVGLADMHDARHHVEALLRDRQDRIEQESELVEVAWQALPYLEQSQHHIGLQEDMAHQKAAKLRAVLVKYKEMT